MAAIEVRDLAAAAADRFLESSSASPEHRQALIEVVELEFRRGIDQSAWIFLPNSNPVQRRCELPRNEHNFMDSGQAKYCTGCRNYFCNTHAIAKCPLCGTIL